FFMLADNVAGTHAHLHEQWSYEGICLVTANSKNTEHIERLAKVIQAVLAKPSFFEFTKFLELPVLKAPMRDRAEIKPLYNLVAMVDEGRLKDLDKLWKEAEPHVTKYGQHNTLTKEAI